MNFQRILKTPIRRLVEMLPLWISPMHLTWLRIALIPVIAVLLIFDYYAPATLFFLLAAFADALDGELARERNQITQLGIVLDPIADKLLIGTVAVLLIPPFFGWPFVAALIVLELAIAAAAYVRDRRAGAHLGASLAGKLKMTAQAIALITLLISASTNSKLLAEAALILLIVTIVLSIVTVDSYIRYSKT